MAIYSEFSHSKWWFSIAMLNYQRVNGSIRFSTNDGLPQNQYGHLGSRIGELKNAEKGPIRSGCKPSFDQRYSECRWKLGTEQLGVPIFCNSTRETVKNPLNILDLPLTFQNLGQSPNVLSVTWTIPLTIHLGVMYIIPCLGVSSFWHWLYHKKLPLIPVLVGKIQRQLATWLNNVACVSVEAKRPMAKPNSESGRLKFTVWWFHGRAE